MNNNQFTVFSKNELFGIKDLNGNVVVAPYLGTIGKIKNGMATVEVGDLTETLTISETDTGYNIFFLPYNASGEVIFSADFRRAWLNTRNKLKRLFDCTTGKWLDEEEYRKVELTNKNKSVCMATITRGTKVFVDFETGKVLTTKKFYREIEEVNFSWADFEIEDKDGNLAFLDKNLNEVSDWYCYFDSRWSNGFPIFGRKKDDNTENAVFDLENGKIVTDWFDDMYRIEYDVKNRIVVEKDGKKAVMSSCFVFLTDFEYYENIFIEEGYLLMHSKSGVHFIVPDCETVIKTRYSDLTIEEHLIITENEFGEYGLMDKQGNIIIEPRFYGMAREYEGIIRVEIERDVGHYYNYISLTGEFVFDHDFNYASYRFCNGTACVKEGKFGYVKSDGTYLTDDLFDFAEDVSEFHKVLIVGKDFYSKVFRIKKRRYAYMYYTGEMLTDYCFKEDVTYYDKNTENTNLNGEKSKVKDYFKKEI